MIRLICIDDSGQYEDMPFRIKKGNDYEPLEYKEFDGVGYYLIHKAHFFKYYFEVRMFQIVHYDDKEADKLLRFMTSEYYETILNDK